MEGDISSDLLGLLHLDPWNFADVPLAVICEEHRLIPGPVGILTIPTSLLNITSTGISLKTLGLFELDVYSGFPLDVHSILHCFLSVQYIKPTTRAV